jgi:glutamate-1-semialdehyde 2,1-aminomutase
VEYAAEVAESRSFGRSHERLEKARHYLASGTASTLRLAVRPTPLFIERGEGAEIVDVDGNRLIDYTLAYGPLILGHAHPAVVDAVSAAVRSGSTFGAQHDGESAVAARICALVPNAELVCFSNSGTEAVMAALRIARAAAGRSRIVRFAGHYHGWADGILTADQVAGAEAGWHASPGSAGQPSAALADVLVLPWNDAAAVEAAFDRFGDGIAAVICEPVLCNSGCIAPAPGFLQRLRALTRRHQSILIFDEVITGFRLGLGGAQERFNVDADLMIFGKALAAGFPLSAVAGRAETVGVIANRTIEHMGTLNANPVATAAATAALDLLAADHGAAFGEMARLGQMLADGIAAAAAAFGIPLVINTAGQVFQTIFTDETAVADYESYCRRDVERARRFAELLMYEGIYVRPSGLWYLSTAHTEAHVEATLRAVGRGLGRL